MDGEGKMAGGRWVRKHLWERWWWPQLESWQWGWRGLGGWAWEPVKREARQTGECLDVWGKSQGWCPVGNWLESIFQCRVFGCVGTRSEVPICVHYKCECPWGIAVGVSGKQLSIWVWSLERGCNFRSWNHCHIDGPWILGVMDTCTVREAEGCDTTWVHWRYGSPSWTLALCSCGRQNYSPKVPGGRLSLGSRYLII